ncbi:MAG: M48 family metalloprotease [Burkholderiales bacterium]|nr:M48 family metalloprotease [Burkholderiales bacterium]
MHKLINKIVLAVAMVAALAGPALVAAAPSVKAASSAASSVNTAQRVADLLGNLLTKAEIAFNGSIRLTKKTGFLAEATFGAPGHVTLGESYANQLTDGELTFVLSHELAHLMSNHSARLKAFYNKQKSVGLTDGESDTNKNNPEDVSALHHELEMDADRIGVEWTLRAGYSASDAATALERAYGGSQQVTGTHPTVQVRTSALLAAN